VLHFFDTLGKKKQPVFLLTFLRKKIGYVGIIFYFYLEVMLNKDLPLTMLVQKWQLNFRVDRVSGNTDFLA
jgi:hypothetical protein